jgi:putative holliday junction resolvase
MKLMAIDFGEKRVGIASTDETGDFALPRMVLPNDDALVGQITRLSDDWQVERIIIGESNNMKGEPNPIQSKAEEFARQLDSIGKSVEFHPEFFTSLEAKHLQGENDMLDASAAALILKSYIDSRKI